MTWNPPRARTAIEDSDASFHTDREDNFRLAQVNASVSLADDDAENVTDEEDDAEQNEPASENTSYSPTQAYLHGAPSFW